MKKVIWFLLCFFAMNAYSNDEVSLTLVGYISPVCGFTTQNNNLHFSSDGLASTKLVINCNSPMRVSMQSENGGLRHQQSTQINAYNLNWSIEGVSSEVSATALELKSIYNFDVDEILRQLLINKTEAIFKIKTMVLGEVTINNSRQKLTL